MPSSAYAAFSTVSLLPVPMAIRSGLAVSVRGRASSSTPWSQLAATFLGVDAGVDILQLKDESWTRESSLLPVFSALAVLASEFGERKRGGFRFLAPRTRPVRHRRAGRYRSRRLLLARAATTRRRRAWDGQVRRKSCPPAPPIAAMCWAACRRARSRLRGAVRESAPWWQLLVSLEHGRVHCRGRGSRLDRWGGCAGRKRISARGGRRRDPGGRRSPWTSSSVRLAHPGLAAGVDVSPAAAAELVAGPRTERGGPPAAGAAGAVHGSPTGGGP